MSRLRGCFVNGQISLTSLKLLRGSSSETPNPGDKEMPDPRVLAVMNSNIAESDRGNQAQSLGGARKPNTAGTLPAAVPHNATL